MGLVHIGKGGLARPCVAQKGNCPYGGAEAHWGTAEEAGVVADDINRQLSNLDGFGIATNGDYAAPNSYTRQAILKLANLDAKIKKMDAYQKKARKNILKELKAKGVKTVDTGTFRATFSEGGKVSRRIDSEEFYADTNINQDEYLKDVNVSTYATYENESKHTAVWNKANMETAPDFNFEVIQKDGKVTVSDDVKESLGHYQAFEEKLKTAKQMQKSIQLAIKEKMDEKDVKEIRVGAIKIGSTDAHTRQQIDTKKLKADGLYDKYVKEGLTKDSVRLTFR